MKLSDLRPRFDDRYGADVAWVTDGVAVWMLFRCGMGNQPSEKWAYNVFTTNFKMKSPHESCTYYDNKLELQCFLADKRTYEGPYE